jgi:large subunit ribosomal protein L25
MTENSLLTIEGQIRTQTGKGYCRKLRAKGLVPANLLDGKNAPSAVEIASKWLSKVWQNGKVFKLSLSGNLKTVAIKEIQIDAVKRTVVHVDLMYK